MRYSSSSVSSAGRHAEERLADRAAASQKPSRVALIGVSGYASIHYKLLLKLQDAERIEIVACVVINPEQEAAKVKELEARGCGIYRCYKQMFREHHRRVDLCIIPTPTAYHAQMTKAALAAGANVLVEKPLAATMEEVEHVRAAEQASGRFVAVGFQDLFVEQNLHLKRALLDGAIGRLVEVRTLGLWPRALNYYQRNDWAGAIKRGENWFLDSPISNAFAHFLNLPLFMAGREFATAARVEKVEAELFRVQPIENFCTAALRIRTDANIVIHAYFSHSCEREVPPQMVFLGENGSVEWDYLQRYVVRPSGGEAWEVTLPDLEGVREAVYTRLLAKLADRAIFTCGIDVAAEHVRCFNLVQGATTIQELGPPWRQEHTSTVNGSRQIVIEGVEEMMLRAFKKGKLLREVGCSWIASEKESV